MDIGLKLCDRLPREALEDPYGPEPGEWYRCLHCGWSSPAEELRYSEFMWWCPRPGCDGAGVGIDLEREEEVPDEG